MEVVLPLTGSVVVVVVVVLLLTGSVEVEVEGVLPQTGSVVVEVEVVLPLTGSVVVVEVVVLPLTGSVKSETRTKPYSDSALRSIRRYMVGIDAHLTAKVFRF